MPSFVEASICGPPRSRISGNSCAGSSAGIRLASWGAAGFGRLLRLGLPGVRGWVSARERARSRAIIWHAGRYPKPVMRRHSAGCSMVVLTMISCAVPRKWSCSSGRLSLVRLPLSRANTA